MAASTKPNLAGGRSVLDSFGFFEAAILYIFGHIPTNAYAILAARFQQEFKHPKFKHPNGIPETSKVNTASTYGRVLANSPKSSTVELDMEFQHE